MDLEEKRIIEVRTQKGVPQRNKNDRNTVDTWHSLAFSKNDICNFILSWQNVVAVVERVGKHVPSEAQILFGILQNSLLAINMSLEPSNKSTDHFLTFLSFMQSKCFSGFELLIQKVALS